MEEIKDYLGMPVIIGKRAVMVQSYSHDKYFNKVTVVKIDLKRTYANGVNCKDCVGIVTDGNKRIGWTYPTRLIMEDSFNVKI